MAGWRYGDFGGKLREDDNKDRCEYGAKELGNRSEDRRCRYEHNIKWSLGRTSK